MKPLNRVKLTALRSQVYDGRRLQTGDTFEARPSDARLLMAMRAARAFSAPVAAIVTKPPAESPPVESAPEASQDDAAQDAAGSGRRKKRLSDRAALVERDDYSTRKFEGWAKDAPPDDKVD